MKSLLEKCYIMVFSVELNFTQYKINGFKCQCKNYIAKVVPYKFVIKILS